MRRDKNYKIFLWTQLPSNLIKCPILKLEDDQQMNEDSENEFDPAQDDSSESDEESLFNKIIYQPVPMIKDDYDYLFYVVMINNEMCVMEGNPKDP